jgi:hypothetical protein
VCISGSEKKDLSASPLAAIVAGMPIKRAGSLQIGRAGDWYYSTLWREPVLLTVAHVLATHPGEGDAVSSVLRLDPPMILCAADSGLPAAAAVECGRHELRYGITSADALLALSLDASLIPDSALKPGDPGRLHRPGRGDRLVLRVPGLPDRAGRVVETDWESGHYGAECDLLIDGLDALPGDSGAVLVDEATGAPSALLVGDARSVFVGERHYDSVVCAHPLGLVLQMFGGFEWLLRRG